MELEVFNEKGEKKEKISLEEKIFGIKLEPDLVYQVVVSLASNKRQNIAHTKDRSEVSGGGRKPWRQKGTGRARHGSIRSPLWRHGGITFGPRKERIFKKRVPLKMKRKAFLMIWAEKIKKGLVKLVEGIKMEKPKTKEMKIFLEKIFPEGKFNCLIVTPQKEENIYRAAKNISRVKVLPFSQTNCLDLLSYKYVLTTPETIREIEKKFSKI